jgi:zinc transporter 2
MNPEDSTIRVSSGPSKENIDAALSIRKTSKGDFNNLHNDDTNKGQAREHSATLISLKEKQIIEKIRKSGAEGQKNAIKKLIIVSIICLFFMSAELVGGIMSGSLAILSDAAHMLSDFSGFAISMISIIISRNKPTFKLSYGYHRAEVIGALCSILLIWGLTAWLIYEAVEKVVKDVKVEDPLIMLIVAIIGLICNIVMGHVLHSAGGHHHGHSHGGHDHGHDHGHSHGEKEHSHSHDDKKDKKDKKTKTDKKKVSPSAGINNLSTLSENNIKEPLLPEENKNSSHNHKDGEKCGGHDHDHKTEETHEHNHKDGEKCGGHDHDHKNEETHEHNHKDGEKCGGHDGHDHDGHDGHNHDGHDHDGHDHDGHNHDGHNHDGHNHDGNNHDGHDHDGHNHDGHNHDGHNHDGHDHDLEHNEDEEHHHNLNIRAAFIHVIGDLIQSVGVVIAAVCILVWPNLYIIDPVCTFLFSVIVFFTTIPILCDCIRVFMEGAPIGVEPIKILADLYTVYLNTNFFQIFC